MGLFSALHHALIKNNANRDDYISQEDYDYVQGKFREMYDAQQNGDNDKAQKIWDDLNKK